MVAVLRKPRCHLSVYTSLDKIEHGASGQKYRTVATAKRRAWDRVIPLFAAPPCAPPTAPTRSTSYPITNLNNLTHTTQSNATALLHSKRNKYSREGCLATPRTVQQVAFTTWKR